MKDYSFYLEGTNGKGVLLVHGLTGAPGEMKFVGKQLHKQGFTVYAPMLAGHCMDEKALVLTRYENWIDSLRTALDRFGPEITEIHAAGICVGGGLALYLAHLHPERLKSVVIYSATLNYDGWSSPWYYALGPYGIPLVARLPGIRNVGYKENPPYGVKSDRVRHALIGDGSGIEGTLARFPLRSLHQNYRLNAALKKALPKMRVPTLLIHAREDDVSHPRNAYKIQKHHGGTCDVVLLEDSYHLIHVDQERRKTGQLTGDFFLAQGAVKHG